MELDYAATKGSTANAQRFAQWGARLVTPAEHEMPRQGVFRHFARFFNENCNLIEWLKLPRAGEAGREGLMDVDHFFAELAAKCLRQLQKQGYAVLPKFLTDEQLAELRMVSGQRQ